MKTPGASWKATRASAVGSSWASKTGDSQHRDAGALRGVERRRGFGQGLGPRLEGDEEPFGVVQERSQGWKVGDRRVKRLRALRDRFLDEGPGDAGEGGEGAVEGDEEVGVDLATGAMVALKSSSARQKPAKSVGGATRLRSGAGAFGQFAQGAEGRVQLRPAAGQSVAEAGLVLADPRPRFFVEGAEELVDVDRFRPGRAERDRFAGVEAPGGVAGDDLHVLEAERRLRAG